MLELSKPKPELAHPRSKTVRKKVFWSFQESKGGRRGQEEAERPRRGQHDDDAQEVARGARAREDRGWTEMGGHPEARKGHFRFFGRSFKENYPPKIKRRWLAENFKQPIWALWLAEKYWSFNLVQK